MSCPGVLQVRDGETVKRCGYCGSLSVEDAIKFLKQPGTRFSGSDWKYGWPHKFYIEPLNPDADKLVEIGSKDGDGTDRLDYWSCYAHPSRFEKQTPCQCPREEGVTGHYSRAILGQRKSLHFKFYNIHLKDVTDDVFIEFNQLSIKLFNITWERVILEGEVRLRYSSPTTSSIYGFQRAGNVTETGESQYSL